MNIDYGWILCSGGYASGGMNLAAENIKWDIMRDPMIEHYPKTGHIGYDLETEWINVKIQKIHARTFENATGIIKNLRDYNSTGAWEMELQIDSNGNKFPWDGDITGIRVFFKNLKGISMKGVKGNLFVIEIAQFEQGGNP